MPSLDVSELNIVIAVLGAFIILYGFISVKIKQVWYLGEALPAVLIGVILGPIAARFLDAEKWGSAATGQQEAITLACAESSLVCSWSSLDSNSLPSTNKPGGRRWRSASSL